MRNPIGASIALLAMLLGAAACSEATTVDVFNNTGVAITVSSCVGQQLVQPNAVGLLQAIPCSDKPTVSIQSDLGTWFYASLLDPNSPFAQSKLRGRHFPMGIKYFAQLEKDGTAYFLPPSYRLPVVTPQTVPGVVTVLPGRDGA